MLRSFAAAVILVSCLSAVGWAQSPSTNVTATSPSARSTAKGPAKTKPAETGPCQIGVIPIAGDLFLVEKFGPIKLADVYDRVSVDGWALDELVVARVRTAAPGMSVQRIPFTRKELANHPRPALFGRDENIAEFARQVAHGRNCERYVLVHRHGGAQREFGIGISKHYLARHANLFAMMYIRVYDGRTFQLINAAPALMHENTFANRLKYYDLGGPSRQIDLAEFPEKAADAVASPVLRNGVREMLATSLDWTLPGLLRPQSREAAR